MESWNYLGKTGEDNPSEWQGQSFCWFVLVHVGPNIHPNFGGSEPPSETPQSLSAAKPLGTIIWAHGIFAYALTMC